MIQTFLQECVKHMSHCDPLTLHDISFSGLGGLMLSRSAAAYQGTVPGLYDATDSSVNPFIMNDMCTKIKTHNSSA